MNEIMKFENTAIDIQMIDGVWMLELYSVGMALGYARSNGKSTGEHGVHPENRTLFPYKSRIDKVVHNAEIKPCVRNAHKYITESQLYDFMLEARTDKCRAFRKWLTNEVLPALNHQGSYSIPEEGVQLPLPEKPYEYFDKTWNGEPVLTSEDFAHLTGLYRSFCSWHFRKHDFTRGVDFYLLDSKDSAKFRIENPKMPRNSHHLYLITAAGFRKLCKYAGIEVEEPKLFIETQAVSNKPRTAGMINRIAKDLGIELKQLNRELADKLGYENSTITGESILTKDSSGLVKIFTDGDAGFYEGTEIMMRLIGFYLLGGTRTSVDGLPLKTKEINDEARIFATVFMALRLFADYGGFDTITHKTKK